MIPIAEEEPKMGPEAPERDGDMSKLPASTLGICSMECLRNKGVQGRRSQNAEAFEAGYDDGYGDGYVDGYDDGQYNQLIGLIREYEDWLNAMAEGTWHHGVLDVINDLRARLEHDDRP